MQHGMDEEEVAVSFAFGSPDSPQDSVYADIVLQPDGFEGRSWGGPGAAWRPDAGIAALPWDDVVAAEDSERSIIASADAAYDAAVDLAGWSADLVGPRHDGWYASRTPPAGGNHFVVGSGPGR